MLAYVVRRVLVAVPVVVVVLVVSFAMLHFTPGDPVAIMLGTDATPEQIAAARERLGLDQSVVAQFLGWLGDVVHGNFGESLFLTRSVGATIWDAGRLTLTIALVAQLVATVVGVAAGILASLRHGRFLDTAVMAGSVVGIAVPNFVVAIGLVVVFSTTLRWLPPTGYVPFATDPTGSVRSLVLPVLALALAQAPIIARMTRSGMLDVLGSDYMVMARAKGLSRRQQVLGHAFPNALGPTLQTVGLSFGSLVAGAVIVEVIFTLPGLGRLSLQAVQNRDVILLQGVMVVVTVLYLLITMLTDVVQAMLNPRVRLE